MRAQAQSLPLTRDLVGRLSAFRTADVRARVAGILQKRLYREGSEVAEGQALFQIDPDKFLKLLHTDDIKDRLAGLFMDEIHPHLPE